MAAAARGRSGFPSRVTVGHEPAYIRRHYTVSHQAPQGELSFLSCASCLSSRLVTAGGCRTAPLASASRSPTSMLQYGTRPQHRPRCLLTRQQVSGVLVSVLVMSRSFGTRMNAMEVPASSPSPFPALSLMLSLILGMCRPSSEILHAPLPSSTDSRDHPSRRRPLLVHPPPLVTLPALSQVLLDMRRGSSGLLRVVQRESSAAAAD